MVGVRTFKNARQKYGFILRHISYIQKYHKNFGEDPLFLLKYSMRTVLKAAIIRRLMMIEKITADL